MAIERLPQLVVNQIAAGEVIERPASVVKELVENSLDSGATRVDVTVEEGGARLVRVSDNGAGIAEAELPLAITPHATSKLREAAQLEAVGTLGFRGEALASIASVSRLRLTSRATVDGQVAESGACIEVAGDEVSEVAPAAGAPGTVIDVRDLFFNTPARRKFLRTAQTEIGHIHDTINRLAIAQPAVSFSVTHNERKTLDYPVRSDWHQRCVDVLGTELGQAMLPFERREPAERGGGLVFGLAGTPDIARASNKHQYVALNGRPIRDRNLSHAIKEAYRGLIPPEKHPVAVVLLQVDPAAADVNVHPTKAEVRFRQPSQMHGLVLAALRQQLLGHDLTPAASTGAAASQASGRVAENHRPSSPWEGLRQQATSTDRLWEQLDRGAANGPGASHHPQQHLSTDAFVDYFKRMDPTQKGFVYQQVKQALVEEATDTAAPEDEGGHGEANAADASVSDEQAQQAASMLAGGRLPESPALRAQSVLQVHNSYVVTQDDQGLLIVDQHALHERVMFEELRQRVLGQQQPLESQRLLMPAVVEWPDGQALVERLAPLLHRIGIELEPFGQRQLAVQAFPSFLFDRHVEPAEFVRQLLDKAANEELRADEPTSEEAALHEVLDMMACKAAVKAGDQLSEQELAALLAKRDEVERSSNCPHGRPTSLRLTLKDLEKQFGRA
jgi:DNA mismatch repair protein MutL